MEKDFDVWNKLKKQTNAGKPRFYTVREIWWCQLGLNIGVELDGKGENYLRPVVILRGFGANSCLVVPLTTSIREHPLRVSVGMVSGYNAHANLSQLRIVDTRRLVEKIGFLERGTFENIRKTARGLI